MSQTIGSNHTSNSINKCNACNPCNPCNPSKIEKISIKKKPLTKKRKRKRKNKTCRVVMFISDSSENEISDNELYKIDLNKIK